MKGIQSVRKKLKCEKYLVRFELDHVNKDGDESRWECTDNEHDVQPMNVQGNCGQNNKEVQNKKDMFVLLAKHLHLVGIVSIDNVEVPFQTNQLEESA